MSMRRRAFAFLLAGACTPDVISLGDGRSLPDFAEPVPVEGVWVEGARDDDPSLSADHTLLVFNSRREGGSGKEDIWWTTRSADNAPWEAPKPIEALNTAQRETGLSLSSDGLTLWFSSDRPGGDGGLDVYLARRASRQVGWEGAERVAELSSEDDDLISAVSDDGLIAYLARRRKDEDYDLFVAERERADERFGPATALSELNTSREESDAFEFDQGQKLVLTRAGDLWLATRRAGERAFAMRGKLDALNSDADDRDAWFSQDGRYVMFSSDRGGEDRLYEARAASAPQ